MSCHAAGAALIAIADQLLSKSNCSRWVKPANILVESASSGVWLTGFGIASRLPRERSMRCGLAEGHRVFDSCDPTMLETPEDYSRIRQIKLRAHFIREPI
jgi:hypothetical protein